MKLKDIIIPKKFTRTTPNPTKLATCEKYYKKYGELDKPITKSNINHIFRRIHELYLKEKK